MISMLPVIFKCRGYFYFKSIFLSESTPTVHTRNSGGYNKNIFSANLLKILKKRQINSKNLYNSELYLILETSFVIIRLKRKSKIQFYLQTRMSFELFFIYLFCYYTLKPPLVMSVAF